MSLSNYQHLKESRFKPLYHYPLGDLYKQSGVYEFSPGFVWCNFGIFDKQNWNQILPIKEKVNIACYHGSINGVKTDYNFCFTWNGT